MTDEYSSLLKPFRKEIDSLDEKLVDLLAQREKIIHAVAKIKAQHNIPAVLQSRVDEVRENAVEIGKTYGADENYIREIYKTIIRLSCEIEEQNGAHKND